jgi:DNA mismatch repair protein MutS
MAGSTPMVKQYQEIKSDHKDAILFFRLGDFYEMFNDDALLASKELEITLTGRGDGESRMPMCGIPYHAAESYIARLIGRGHKVAICEQMEPPGKPGSKVVKREVIKIVTPGTVIEPSMLNERRLNWLAAVSFLKGSYGFAVIDASTGEFKVTQVKGPGAAEELLEEIDRVSPAECLVPDIVPDELKQILDFCTGKNIPVTAYKDVYDPDVSSESLKTHFKVSSLEGFGLSVDPAPLGAAAAVLDYLKSTQKTTLGHVSKIQTYRIGNFMFLDSTTRRNLEVIQTIRDKSFTGSLLWVLDETRTSMGSRLLQNWVLEPLLDVPEIELRLDAVEELSSSAALREDLGGELDSVSDIERLTGRVSTRSANARDIVSLKESLMRIPRIKNLLKGSRAKMLRDLLSLSDMEEVSKKIDDAIVSEPPLAISGGGFIRDGHNKELDELRSLTRGGKEWIAELESRERARTGIKSLKVGFTKVFGYYIEITKANLSQAPAEYIRKQTLVNAERFVTPELKDRESMILNAQSKIGELEYALFCEVRDFVASHVKELQKIARGLARVDVLLSFAKVALQQRFCRPKFVSERISIKDCRHPVVERTLGQHKFVPNDVTLDGKSNRFLLITGPNMAGKSTYMRQAALASLMAQVGSFVPASSAEVCVVDRIFTRIGAMDDIFSGQSTFMLEMTETANILNNATEKSLIILDEIGRGTSTFDGMSIAAAVAEHINSKLHAKTLFATHYHELTQLEARHEGIKNLSVAVREEGDHVTFLHKIVPGPADRSYGIQVAKLAGLPKGVIERAKEVYNTLEMVENDLSAANGGKTKGVFDG